MLNKKYYLETGVLREISPYLCSEFIHKYCYTSIHSLCELLTDLKNDDEYIIKKKVLKNVFESKIETNWDLPQKIILSSFGIENVYNKISKEEIEIIINVMQTSSNMDIFLHDVNISNSLIYDKICNYDSFYLDGFRNEKSRGYNDFQRLYSNFNKNGLENLSTLIKNDINWLVSFIIATRMVIANNMSRDKVNINKISPCDLMLNYNGNVDMFIFAYGFYSLLEIPNNPNIGKKKRNDFNDIFHLTYINSCDDILVIKDNIFNKLLNELFQNNIINIEKLKSRIKNV